MIREYYHNENGSCLHSNWRITFRIEDGEVSNLDLEDYH